MSQRLQEPLDWRETLRRARKQRRVTQAELARRSGLSLAAIKAYESGERHPKADSLKAVVDALGLPLEETNQVLGAAGYAVDADAIFNAGFRAMSLAELEAEARACPWPALITNRSYDVVAGNVAFQRLLEVDLSHEYAGFGERNLLAQITREGFASRLGNWDEVVRFMIGLAKGDPRWQPDDLSRPAPWLQVPLQRFLEGDPRRVRRFFDLWESAPRLPHRLRQRFRIIWHYRGQVAMTFHGVLALANLSDELHWNEWIPADGETWAALTEITATG